MIEFEAHQGSVLSPLLFVAVMEVLTQEVRDGSPWKLLYVDDLVLMTESMEVKRLKVNIGKTKEGMNGD